jgi:hypothetical protein
MTNQIKATSTTDKIVVESTAEKFNEMLTSFKQLSDEGYVPIESKPGDNLISMFCEVSESLDELWNIIDEECQYDVIKDWLFSANEKLSRLSSAIGIPPIYGIKRK